MDSKFRGLIRDFWDSGYLGYKFSVEKLMGYGISRSVERDIEKKNG